MARRGLQVDQPVHDHSATAIWIVTDSRWVHSFTDQCGLDKDLPAENWFEGNHPRDRGEALRACGLDGPQGRGLLLQTWTFARQARHLDDQGWRGAVVGRNQKEYMARGTEPGSKQEIGQARWVAVPLKVKALPIALQMSQNCSHSIAR